MPRLLHQLPCIHSGSDPSLCIRLGTLSLRAATEIPRALELTSSQCDVMLADAMMAAAVEGMSMPHAAAYIEVRSASLRLVAAADGDTDAAPRRTSLQMSLVKAEESQVLHHVATTAATLPARLDVPHHIRPAAVEAWHEYVFFETAPIPEPEELTEWLDVAAFLAHEPSFARITQRLGTAMRDVCLQAVQKDTQVAAQRSKLFGVRACRPRDCRHEAACCNSMCLPVATAVAYTSAIWRMRTGLATTPKCHNT